MKACVVLCEETNTLYVAIGPKEMCHIGLHVDNILFEAGAAVFEAES